MSKFNEKEWQEFLDNMTPGYSRTVNNNKLKNTQDKNMNNLNNQSNQSNKTVEQMNKMTEEEFRDFLNYSKQGKQMVQTIAKNYMESKNQKTLKKK
jgi:hypothetical protein